MGINVILADDHAIVREGIKIVLQNSDKEINIIGEAVNGRELITLAQKQPADIYLLDIAMPVLNGIETAGQLVKMDPQSKIIILSMHDDKGSVEKALKCGVQGYLLKANAVNEVVDAVESVYQGKCYFSPGISSHILEGFLGKRYDYAKQEKIVELTAKEKEVLQLIAEGLSSKEIAAQLKITFNTVKIHRTNIMNKIGSHKQADLVRYAIKEGISPL